MPKVYRRAKARSDLIERYVYLAEHTSVVVAGRFLVNAEASFTALATQPSIGSATDVAPP